MDSDSPRPRRIAHERRVLVLALASGAPAMLVVTWLLFTGDFSARTRWTLEILLGGSWLVLAFTLREEVIRPLQTLSNMLAALRESDFSIRGRGANTDDALGLALLEANTLGNTLREQRLGALEAHALLRRVMEDIDVAVFAFDEDERLRLVNRRGELVLGRPAQQLLGRGAKELGADELLRGAEQRMIGATFPGGAGRWELRRGIFRQGGRPHALVLLTEVSETLRAEERQAWQRLIRVLSHEINNTLTPIKSIAGSLQDRLRADRRSQVPVGVLPPGATPTPIPEDDFQRGLTVIASRAESLSRFIGAYARLSRLPTPRKQPVAVDVWVKRVAALEPRVPVRVLPGPPVTVIADSDQLDQLLINLLRNGAEAAMETGGSVQLRWEVDGPSLAVHVEDDGHGLSDTANLFVPFFTTKPNGSGIGLALCRQIAEAHGGALVLENRGDVRGCRATLRLPL